MKTTTPRLAALLALAAGSAAFQASSPGFSALGTGSLRWPHSAATSSSMHRRSTGISPLSPLCDPAHSASSGAAAILRGGVQRNTVLAAETGASSSASGVDVHEKGNEAASSPAGGVDTINDEGDKKLVAQTMEPWIYDFNKVVIDTVYQIICFLYPVRGNERDFARFYVLETVARVPYFAYLSVMHLRETFGERSAGLSERMRTHYAEADNELHHLLIMEALGGNSSVVDRTVAQTMAFGYYWYVTAVYAANEPAAYHLSELIENHAYDTYNGYLNAHEDMLKKMPVPPIAKKYYVDGELPHSNFVQTLRPFPGVASHSNRRHPCPERRQPVPL
jgi:ubiquinol oxidase